MSDRLTIRDRMYRWGEAQTLRFVSAEGPGRVMKVLYRTPVLLYRLGLGRFLGRHVLLLRVRGRKTGRWRAVPLGYQTDADGNHIVIAGWGERSQWVRNIHADPRVRVEVGRTKYRARVETVGEPEAIAVHRAYLAAYPGTESAISRITGKPFDGSEEALRELAESSPVMRLRSV